MDLEEEQTKKKSQFEVGMDLSDLSVDELHEMAEILRQEISRLNLAAKEKADHLSAADALFKT
ncbi:MAG: DUF1192 domain-containing protein [Pseudomonadota bacterium]